MHYGMGDPWILPSMWTYTPNLSMVAAHILYVHLPLQGYGGGLKTVPEVRTSLQFTVYDFILTPYEDLWTI